MADKKFFEVLAYCKRVAADSTLSWDMLQTWNFSKKWNI